MQFPPYQTPKRGCFYIHMCINLIFKPYNGKQKIINNIFSTYVENLLNDVNHPALVQKRKLNIDTAVYGKKIIAKVNRPSDKK